MSLITKTILFFIIAIIMTGIPKYYHFKKKSSSLSVYLIYFLITLSISSIEFARKPESICFNILIILTGVLNVFIIINSEKNN